MSMVDVEALPPEPPPMADPGGVPMPSMPPVDLSALAGGSGQGYGGGYGGEQVIPAGNNLAELSRQAAVNKREEMAERDKIRGEEDARLNKHRAVMDERFKQTAVNPEDYKPFDTEAAREKYKYNPVEAFGSLGSVFAIVASAFTNRPMENAMYGAAAAMNAVKAGNEQEYERARKDWQDNAALAVKRQAAQHTSYMDAATMVTTDMTIAQDRVKQNALKYGDKQTLALMDAGLWDKALELWGTRDKLNNDLIENAPKLSIAALKQGQWLAVQKLPLDQQLAAIRELNSTWAAGKETVLEKVIRQAQVENGNAPLTVDQLTEVIEKHTTASSRTATATDIGEQMQVWDEANKHIPDSPEKAKLRADELIRLRAASKGGGPGSQQAQDITNLTTEIMAERPELTRPQANELARKRIANANKHDRQLDPVKETFRQETVANAGREPTSAEYVAFEQKRKQAGVALAQFISETKAKTGREPTSEELIKFTQEAKGKNPSLGNYKATEAQAKNLLFATYLDRSVENLARIEKEYKYEPTAKDRFLFELMEGARRQGATNIPAIMANYGLSDAAQQYYNAAREFTAAVLRKETGAAFGQNELTNTMARYIDAPGDGEANRKQKAEARKGQRESMWMGTGLPGNAWSTDAAKKLLGGDVPSFGSGAAAPAPPVEQREAGKTYTTPRGALIWGGDGRWYSAAEWKAKSQ